MSARRKRRWPWILLVIVMAAAGGVFAIQRGSTAAPLDPKLIVTTSRGKFVQEIIETGRIDVRERVAVKSKVAGQVAKVLVEEGAHVEKNDLLLVLDPTDYEREVARASAELAQAKAGLAFAQVVLDRKTAGVEGSVIAAHELDAAKHDKIDKGLQVQLAQVALSVARDKLLYTKIVAPMSGTVVERGIEPGEVVTPGVQSTFEGKPLLTIADLSVLLVKIELNQIDVARVRVGQTVTLTLDALPGAKYEAKITKIAPASVRPAGREVDVFPVEAELTKADGQIKPGMTADVRILLEEKGDVLALPIEAIREEKGKSFVMRVVDGPKNEPITEKTDVTLGARNEKEIEILSGLDVGARVLINPASVGANEASM